MPVWTTACPDWRDRIREGRTLVCCGEIFPDAAKAGMEVFRHLLVPDVLNPAGLIGEDGRPLPPTVEQVCREWILEIAAAIHGSYDIDTGERLIREVFVKVPKKNWKSGFAGLLMVSLMVLNWRQSNEAGIIAPTKDTADNVFKPMRDAIKGNPSLDAVFHIQPNMRTITHRITGMSCRVYAADSDAVAGQKWAFVIFEEVWLLAKRTSSADMVLEATGGQASRPEGVVISITTESDEEPVGFHKAKENFARRVRDGEIDAPHFLPVLYEWPKEMLESKAYLEPANFHLVNPNWGASVDPDDFMRKFTEANEAGGEALRGFLAKRLNVPVRLNMGGLWSGADFWEQNAVEGLTLAELLRRSEVVTIGIDGGGLDDMLGLAVIGREEGTGIWLHWARAWIHPIAVKRRQSEESRYLDFEKDGDLWILKGTAQSDDSDQPRGEDVAAVGDIVEQCEKSGLLDRVGVDTAGIGDIPDEIADRKIDRDTRIVGIPQGWKLNGTITTVERRLEQGTFRHGGQPLMAWCVGNAKVERAGNAVLITKKAAGSAKIDPLMATLNAAALMSMNPKPRKAKHQFFVL